MEGDRPESAEENGRVGEICLMIGSQCPVCEPCQHIGARLDKLQEDPNYGQSLLKAIGSLKTWSREVPTWQLLTGLNNVLKPPPHSWKITTRPWMCLWETRGVCRVCMRPYDANDESQRCFGCLETARQYCLTNLLCLWRRCSYGRRTTTFATRGSTSSPG